MLLELSCNIQETMLKKICMKQYKHVHVCPQSNPGNMRVAGEDGGGGEGGEDGEGGEACECGEACQ